MVALGEHRDGTVMFGSRKPTREVLAGDQPPFAIDRVSVGIEARLPKH
jgi:hypothetical protein